MIKLSEMLASLAIIPRKGIIKIPITVITTAIIHG